MKIGVAFPTTEIGMDPAVIRGFAQEVEALGYDHLTCIDHVMQEVSNGAEDWRAYYTLDNMFHEPLTLFGFLACATGRLELATAILILPQRQTALVAKQAAEIDLLSGGRLRLGVGIGWNAMEFEVLGQSFRNRARRMEEQIACLRQLWTEPSGSFSGKWHEHRDAGINPLPLQRPIPLWIGAFQDPAIERAGRLGDGWFANPRVPPGNEMARQIALARGAAEKAGRDPAALGIDGTIHIGERTPEDAASELSRWETLGVSHVTVRTMYSGFETPAEHLEALRRFRKAMG